jgi:hypothetical protein
VALAAAAVLALAYVMWPEDPEQPPAVSSPPAAPSIFALPAASDDETHWVSAVVVAAAVAALPLRLTKSQQVERYLAGMPQDAYAADQVVFACL